MKNIIKRIIVLFDTQRSIIAFFTLCSIAIASFSPWRYLDAEIIRSLQFPMQGTYAFQDDFGDSRSGGRIHEGIDIITLKMTPAISVVDGEVSYVVIPEASWGYAVYIRDHEGYEYRYLHLNNDTPGTDDGAGGPAHAYAAGIFRGASVTKGQIVGWVGDSGNAERVGAHLHFEIWSPDGAAINPYQSLIKAAYAHGYSPSEERASVVSISEDKALSLAPGNPLCVAHSLVKSSLTSAVYYCGVDGKRYVFPNQNIFRSWYDDFLGVTTVTPDTLANISIGGNVTYRPGVKMVKVQTDPKVYAVARGGILRWVVSAEVAQSLYGIQWQKHVDDLSDAFFVNYTVGDMVSAAIPDQGVSK